MKSQLSDHFTYGKLIKFTLPSIAMMVFTSIYLVVDGFFVSNFAGRHPLRRQFNYARSDDFGYGRIYVRHGWYGTRSKSLCLVSSSLFRQV